MKLNKSIVAICFLWGMLFNVFSQIMTPGRPFQTVQLRNLSLGNSSRILQMPAFDILKEQSTSDSLFIQERRFKFGKSFNVEISPDKLGEWQLLDDGTRIWEVEIISEGALSLNVIFSKFRLPEGAKVYIFNSDRTYVIGAFTALNNKASGVLPTLPVFGDHIIVQYIEPANVAFEGDLCIAKVTHDYRGVYNKLRVGNYGDATSCEVDVSCLEKYDDVKRSAVKMIIAGSEICSGVLVNNTAQDETPYVLSARHCFKLDTTAYSTLIIFNYEVPDCRSAIEGVREQSIAGAEMIAFSPVGALKDIDFALIKASLDIPHTYQPYYAGWNAESSYPRKTFTIHHPLGDVKKVSWDNSSPTATTLEIDYVYFPLSHYRIWSWEGGVTEGGSSGAALFNQDNQVVGALSGGSSSCDEPKNDYFYRLTKAWNPYSEPYRQLRHWLDPSGDNIMEVDGFYPDGVQKMIRTSNIDPAEAIGVLPVNGGQGGYLSGLNSYGSKAVVEHFEDINGVLKGIYFIPFKGSNSDTSVVSVQVWSGDGQPENLVHTESLIINQWTRGQFVSGANYGTSGGFSVLKEYTNDDYDMLCYMPFSSEVAISSDCFVGFSWDELSDTFVVMQTIDRLSTDSNKAWYKNSTSWKPFTDYSIGKPSSLCIELLYQINSGVSVDFNNEQTLDLNIIQDAETVILISDAVVKSDFRVDLYDISGRHLASEGYKSGQNQYDLHQILSGRHTQGIYILDIVGENIRQTEKIAMP